MANDRVRLNLGGQPFEEQIAFFQQKVRLPTKKWTDLWQGQHARAFVVAGATREALLEDFQSALTKAIEKGTGIKEFREDFDRIVASHGWAHKGSPGWRSRVIFETNLRTSYQAGRYQQLTDPAMKKLAPFWIYKHGDSKVPRPEHLAWDGLVLPADDPWWKTHYPPNGWGCTCKVFARTQGDLDRAGLKVSKAPEDVMVTHEVGSGADARTVTVPAGIDPGWDYNVGESAFGNAPLTDGLRDQWEPITPGNWESMGLPRTLPLERPAASIGPEVATEAALAKEFERLWGGPEKVFEFQTPDFTYPVAAEAEVLADHVKARRSRFAPFVEETITDPTEAWMSFERSRINGRIALKLRFIKSHAVERQGETEMKSIVVIATAKAGRLEALTFLPNGDVNYINNQRHGKLLRKK